MTPLTSRVSGTQLPASIGFNEAEGFRCTSYARYDLRLVVAPYLSKLESAKDNGVAAAAARQESGDAMRLKRSLESFAARRPAPLETWADRNFAIETLLRCKKMSMLIAGNAPTGSNPQQESPKAMRAITVRSRGSRSPVPEGPGSGLLENPSGLLVNLGPMGTWFGSDRRA
ncbi:uncharacterized protein K452DRAFT_357217 [Aplosporella prunicola CBS 121167]|uniref:Uncharacterized protein n=1 Tax=Aplosporella prunicola CBS 121167 TaxID=1176127 RepID=A0A6A6BHC4_9PEZI|nr:uncharacterized protein K452DRAFT_357217 [Aplosporella prunicola CBS 121167]KAF2143549.1 hypothetical protein K452DRAFT_357217 [Aplosporella prunicola CBS 121167]